MSTTERLNPTIPKGTLIRSFGDLKHKKVFSDSYSSSALSNKVPKSLPIIEGNLISYKTDTLILHGGSTKELVDFQVVAIANKSLCITILLEGKLDFSYDDLSFSLNAAKKQSAIVVNLTKPVSFRRTLYKNNCVSKLNVILPVDWLESRIQSNSNISTFFTEHLANFELDLNYSIQALTREVISLSNPEDFMSQMQLETSIQNLILLVFKQLNDVIPCIEKQTKSSPVMTGGSFDPTLDKLITYIESNLEQDLSMQHLANLAVMSVSNLQHKFKKSLGISLRSYIRRRRLYIAKQQLEIGLITISEAAYNAGYRHPSNFTSAFKKIFGYPPQELMIKEV